MTHLEARTSIVWDYAPAPESADHIRAQRPLRPVPRRRVPRAGGRRVTSPTINPATEEPIAEVAYGGPGRRDRGRRVRARRAAEVGGAQGPRARQVPVPDRPADPGALARARGRRDARRRQAAARVARRRHPARGRALLPLRRLGGQAPLRRQRPRGRAARGRRADRAVELPAADGGVEARAGARVRQRRDPEAGRDDAADRAAARRDLPGGRAAARRRHHPSGRWRHGRGARARHRTSTRSRSPGSTAVGRDIQAALAGTDTQADARARRQVGEHRVRGRRARSGGRGDRQRDLLQPGPRVLRRDRGC